MMQRAASAGWLMCERQEIATRVIFAVATLQLASLRPYTDLGTPPRGFSVTLPVGRCAPD